MLKNIIVPLALIIGICSCTSQKKPLKNIDKDNPLIKAIDTLTLAEAKKLLEEENQGITMLLNFSSINLELSVETSQKKDTTIFNKNPYKIYSKDTIDKHITDFTDEIIFEQKITPPNSTLRFGGYSTSDLKLKSIEEHWGKIDNPIKLQVEKKFFSDKTTVADTATTTVNSNGYLVHNFSSAKNIDSLNVNFIYSLPNVKEYIIDASTTEVDTIVISYKKVDYNKVQITYPSYLEDNIVSIEAIHKSGEILEEKGISSNSKPTEEMLSYLKEVKSIFSKTIKKIDNNKIKTKEDLKNSLLQTVPQTPINSRTTYTTYSAKGDIDKIKLFINKDKPTLNTKKITIKPPSYKKSNFGYYIAQDSTTNKSGFVNAAGNWVIKPTYNNLEYVLDYYYYTEDTDYTREYLWLNTTNNTLEKIDYVLYRYEIYDGNIVITEKEVNGPKGLINAKTGKVLLPNIYDNIYHEKGYFNVYNNHKTSLYNKYGKQILPEKFNRITVLENSFITEIDKENGISNSDIYTLTGKNITNGRWQNFEGDFGKAGLILASKNYIKDNVNYTDQDAFINENGKVIIDLKGYQWVNIFSNGLAAVKKKGSNLYGYINTKGEVIIPFEYESAKYFQEKYAYVEKHNTAYLIDKNNKVFKKFPDTANSMTLSTDSNNATYSLYNGETYNAEGELLKKEENN
ncbi:WG repeat-containing protein [Cellulophaga fucicola]|uniref:WG repeat-containing protein n=1 Tax=Cellulophaga fucicola TaxID=76595 RepID=UPI003EC0F11D